jgi:hypothetical protein
MYNNFGYSLFRFKAKCKPAEGNLDKGSGSANRYRNELPSIKRFLTHTGQAYLCTGLPAKLVYLFSRHMHVLCNCLQPEASTMQDFCKFRIVSK